MLLRKQASRKVLRSQRKLSRSVVSRDTHRRSRFVSIYKQSLQQGIAATLILLVVPPLFAVQATTQQTTPVPQQGGAAPSIPPPWPNPNSSSSGQTTTPSNLPSAPSSSSQQPAAPQANPQSGAPAPVGTAVAPYEKGIGIAASRPAGVVIAPAKQRQSRAFLIKVGLLIGAGVAVGTVAALAHASPSQPH